jgi:hypothetical protein
LVGVVAAGREQRGAGPQGRTELFRMHQLARALTCPAQQIRLPRTGPAQRREVGVRPGSTHGGLDGQTPYERLRQETQTRPWPMTVSLTLHANVVW